METFLIAIGAFIVALLVSAIKVLNEYERGVMFTLGRFTGIKGPGLIIVIPVIQQMRKIDLRTIVLDVPILKTRPSRHISTFCASCANHNWLTSRMHSDILLVLFK